jgi:hypothetical protein
MFSYLGTSNGTGMGQVAVLTLQDEGRDCMNLELYRRGLFEFVAGAMAAVSRGDTSAELDRGGEG